MKGPSLTMTRKYLSAINKSKRKYLTSDMLSKKIGIYPEVINETLSFFDPMVNLDYKYNLVSLVPSMQKYVEELEANKEPQEVIRISKKELAKYDGIADFFYKKMTMGGFVDPNRELSDEDLRILKKLVLEEIRKRNQLKKKRK